MNRRSSLKSLGVIAAGLALLPSCSDGLPLTLGPDGTFALDANQSTWINSLSQAILPYGDRAIETLEDFPTFIQKMIHQTSNPKKIASFVSGYNIATDQLKEIYNTSAANIKPSDVIEYFTKVVAPFDNTQLSPEEKAVQDDLKVFTNEMRGLSIYHLTTSQAYMEEVDQYNIIPGQYQGAVPV